MKVLFITPSYLPIVGGSEILTRVLAAKLNEIGIKADIMTLNMDKKWCPKWKAEMVKDGMTQVFKIPALNPFPKFPSPLFILLRVNVIPNLNFTKKLRNYDIIHFIGEADLSLAISSYFIKKPKIFHCVAIFKHGGIYQHYMFKRPFLRKIFQKYFPLLSNTFIVYSNENKQLLSNLGVPSRKISTLPLGVDTKAFHPNDADKINNLILFVGRIDRIKGLHILINALSYIKTPIQLVVIGPNWDNEYTREIEQMSRAINGKSIHKIKLLGVVDHPVLVSWYQKASILVCPYLYETFSTVALEALACRTPVISTGTHIGDPESDGILVTPKDPRKLADAISTLLENKELREKLGRDGRKTVEERFSWDSIVKQLAEMYRNMLSN
jgi:glycosyltransferase involved in cell wall biosynthesis